MSQLQMYVFNTKNEIYSYYTVKTTWVFFFTIILGFFYLLDYHSDCGL